MDFLDPAKKRAARYRLIAGYVLIAVAIALVTLILVFQSYGYDLDRKTGSIIQNGLLFVSSQPEQADIYLNGKLIKTQSAARLVLPSDIYKLELKRSGYRSWQRTISLAGGTIERVVYPFLFPSKLDTKDQKTFTAGPSFSTQSPDRHWIVVQEPGQIDKFDVFDTSNFNKEPTVITLPASLMASAPQHQFKLVEWSTDNRHFLVQDNYTGGSEFLMIDRTTPSSSYNVETTFKANPSEVALHDKKYDQLYLYDQSSQVLSQANLKDPSHLTSVASGVLSFKPYGSDLMMYATSAQADPGMVRIMYQDGSGAYLLRQVPAGSGYLMNLAQYNGDWYVAAGSTPDGRIYIYKNPQAVIKQKDPKPDSLFPAVVLRVAGANWLEFSANTQFLVVENGSHLALYDAERQRSYSYTLPQTLDEATPHATWMDGSHLMLNSAGHLVVVDYDGSNSQTLTANLAGHPAFFNRGYSLLFNIAPSIGSPGQFALTRTDLIATKANQPKQ